MEYKNPIRNESGLAMILAVSLIGLLSLFGIWLIQQSDLSYRITTAMNRNEKAFNLAEGSLQLTQRCLRLTPPSLTFTELVSDQPVKIDDDTRLPAYLLADQELPDPGSNQEINPEIYYLDYDTDPPPGWILNKQAYSGFYTVFYMPVGEATVPSEKGEAKTRVYAFAVRILR